MNKQDQIKEWLSRPVQVNDYIHVSVPYTINETIVTGRGKSKKSENVTKSCIKHGYGQVKQIIDDLNLGLLYVTKFDSWSMPTESKVNRMVEQSFSQYGYEIIKAEWATPDTRKCGVDNFVNEPVRMNFYARHIDSILCDVGYDRSNNGYENIEVKTISDNTEDKSLIGCTYGGVNFNPYVIDMYGKKQYFQRGDVWSIDQKQMLIESIYNWIEIGKFVFRYKSWAQLTKEMRDCKHGFNYECVDGKQRLNAIIDFVQGKYPDLKGNYWNDLSDAAQRKFLDYDRLVFAKLEEGTTDADVIKTFLTLNFTGVPMSIEHIKFVQTIKI